MLVIITRCSVVVVLASVDIVSLHCLSSKRGLRGSRGRRGGRKECILLMVLSLISDSTMFLVYHRDPFC